jgi:hypothetical protein
LFKPHASILSIESQSPLLAHLFDRANLTQAKCDPLRLQNRLVSVYEGIFGGQTTNIQSFLLALGKGWGTNWFFIRSTGKSNKELLQLLEFSPAQISKMKSIHNENEKQIDQSKKTSITKSEN